MILNGKEVLIDDDDMHIFHATKWHVCKSRNTFYLKDKLGRSFHRVIMSTEGDQLVDHINRNGLDNRKANLRLCTESQNRANTTKRAGCSSQFKGVLNDRGGWNAAIRKGRQVHIGRYRTEIEAALAYNEAARIIHGQFAVLNPVTPFEGVDLAALRRDAESAARRVLCL